MAKYHINAKGVPAICRATKGNCPFGGEGEHYDTPEQAQEAADKKHAAESGFIKIPSMSAKETQNELREETNKFVDKQVTVKYDGKEFQGKVDSVFLSKDKKPGFIIRGHDEYGAEQYKHIKISRMSDIESSDGDKPEGVLKKAIDKEPIYKVEGGEYKEVQLSEPLKDGDYFANKNDAKSAAEENKINIEKEQKEKSEQKEKIKKLKSEFDSVNVSEDTLIKKNKELKHIENSIKENFKNDARGNKLHKLNFQETSEGKLRIEGQHVDCKGYLFSGGCEIDDFKNAKPEDINKAINEFSEKWSEAANDQKQVKRFQKFIEDGNKYGWD